MQLWVHKFMEMFPLYCWLVESLGYYHVHVWMGIKVVGSEIQKKETAYYKTYKLMQTTERKICACLEMVSYRMFSSENKKNTSLNTHSLYD